MAQQRITIRSLNAALLAILENQVALNRKMDQVMSAEDDLTAAVTSMGNVVNDAANTILEATQALSIAGQANDTVTIEAQVSKLNSLASVLSLANAGLKAIVPTADVPGTTTTTIVTPISGQTSVPDPSTATQVPPLTATQVPPLMTTDVPPLSTTDVPPLSTTSISPLSSTEAPSLSTTGADSLSSTSIPPLSTNDIDTLSTSQVAPLSATQVAPLSPAEGNAATPGPITGTVNTTTKGSTTSTS